MNRNNTTKERRCIHIETTQTQKTYIADHIYRSTYFHDADTGLHQFHSAEEHGNRLLAEMQAAQEETDKNIEGTYQITDFVNGNCFTILYGQEQKDVKLIGIKDKSCSAEDLENFIADDMIDLAFDEQQEDEDGKLIAYAYRADGTFINQELLAMGLAEMKEEKENTMYAEELRMAQEAAKGKGLGRWAKE